MKTKSTLVLLTTVFLMFFNSCSSESSSPTPSVTGSVIVNIDGIAKSFSKIDVKRKEWNDAGTPRVDLLITARTVNDLEVLYLNVGENDLGENQIWGIFYGKGHLPYAMDDSEMTSNVEFNQNRKIKGSFSGSLKTEDGSATYILKSGYFDISY